MDNYWIFLCLGIFFAVFACKSPEKTQHVDESLNYTTALTNKMRGMSLVAPPKPYIKDPMSDLAAIGINWVALHPYGYYAKNKPDIGYGGEGQWWGESVDGIIEGTRLAHSQGIKVMLKPQLWTYNQWIGDLELASDKEWQEWEEKYSKWMLNFAKLSDSLGIEMLCIGTEIRKSVVQRPEYWRKLIRDIRQVYKGELTYASNWDTYEQVQFWDDLDYIGVNAYFVLSAAKTPSVKAMKEAWKGPFEAIKTLHKKWNRPILFTEFGYPSIDKCAHEQWLFDRNRGKFPVNEQAQANALQALIEVFATQEWWQGGVQWKWYPNGQGNEGEGAMAKDYTPQNKKAALYLKSVYLGE